MIINFAELSPNQIYHTLTQTIVPRPIAWVLTENSAKSYNLAPFSYFTAISSNPPILMFSAGKKPEGDYKDTVLNIEHTERAVIHIADPELAEQVTLSAQTLPRDKSELDLLDVELTEFLGSNLPRIKQCKIALACQLHKVVEMGELPMKLVFVEVTHVYIDDAIVTEQGEGRNKIDAMSLNPLSRLGGNEYADLANIITVNRMK